MSDLIESKRAPEPVGAFPHAKRVGELLFLSGIGPRVRGRKEIPGVTRDSAGNVVSYDIETQCRSVFENVRLVLEDAGATWQDIVDVTVFLTNMKKDFPIYNRIAEGDRFGRIRISHRLTQTLKLARFPARSSLPFAALPSISLIPSTRFTD